MAKNKRRQKKYEKIDTSDFEFQGDGTWVKISRKTQVSHYRLSVEAGRLLLSDKEKTEPMDKDNLDLKKLSSNIDLREKSNTAFIKIYKEQLPNILLNWNWATDIEIDIDSINGNKIILAEYLLEDTLLPVSNEFMIRNFSDFRIYLGKYPEDYETYEASFDGFKTITINEKLRRDYVSSDDYIVLGYPSPKSRKTYELLDDNEIIWLGSKVNGIYLERVIAINNDFEEKKRD